MPAIYFGRELKTGSENASAVKTTRGDMEPVRPSDFKVFVIREWVSPIACILYAVLGHLVSVISSVPRTFLAITNDGALWSPPKEVLPIFPVPGFAFAIPKGEILTQTMINWLATADFRSIEFAGKTVWLTDSANRTKFREAKDMVPRMLITGNVPNRYLNPNSMSGYFSLISVTTAIFGAFYRLSKATMEDCDYSTENNTIKGWKDLSIEDVDLTTIVPDENLKPTFTITHTAEASKWEAVLEELVKMGTGTGCNRALSSGVILNPYDTSATTFVSVTGEDSIGTPGKIFKYNKDLALPDTNLIGDVIGRHFLTCLGPDSASQHANLVDLKTAIGNLRFLPVGLILTHMYKCLEICIAAHSGCRPIFAGCTYEGCMLLGGPGCSLLLNDEMVELDSVEDLSAELATVSSHAAALYSIEALFMASGGLSGVLPRVKSMFALRKLLIPLKFNQTDRDQIHQYSRDLDFTEQPWGISAGTLQRAFTLIKTPSLLDSTYPISRFSLFSSDPVRVAFSCFGETSCPSWDIPNGKVVRIGANPPSVVDNGRPKPGSRAVVTSDADWVMTIRTTDLLACCEDFKKMAGNMSYRTVPSTEARKRGFRSFSRTNMAVFWKDMVDAIGVTNPHGELAEGGGFKRKATDSGSGIAGEGTVHKRRAMGF